MGRLKASRDSLIMTIDLKDSLQSILQEQVGVKQEEADMLRHQVDFREKRREEELY